MPRGSVRRPPPERHRHKEATEADEALQEHELAVPEEDEVDEDILMAILVLILIGRVSFFVSNNVFYIDYLVA